MAILEPNNDHDQQETQAFSLESLLCEEEDAFESLEQETSAENCNFDLVKEDLPWEDEELVSMFSREKQTHVFLEEKDHSMVVARRRAIEWMLKVKTYFGFSCLTTFLAINYLDRFLCSFQVENDKPWMMHITAVTCLILAAKIEETKVPTLLDLQVVNSKFMFEAKTIRKMELFVMSTLRWRMNPVTPFSFLDHITRRLGLKSDLHWVFFRKCEALFLSAVCDGRFVRYLPSVLATSTMLHVIHQVEPSNAVHYQHQLFSVLKTSKENISECYELIGNISNTCWIDQRNSHKRNYEEIQDTKNETIDVY